ncbi:hypothetical protein [Plastoroseomonas arctica]|uniref:Transmembrane protein n=1 Tax=Plastoroseomonas arctica TaxID=1509237 RepID=A0AAF1JXS6_9PROT|nr:hypothetical protein [Plastoroseomonas arctica]MBR0656027.1 hypothetical protein [Plastoroseomonas arctica]
MNTTRRPPIIDMTPEGEFRDPAPRPAPGRLDRILTRVGGMAMLLAILSGALVLAAVAVMAVAVLLPVAIIAGLIGGATLWWRIRRARAQGTPVRFGFVRR